jgi:hypothetical protein
MKHFRASFDEALAAKVAWRRLDSRTEDAAQAVFRITGLPFVTVLDLGSVLKSRNGNSS